MYLCHQNSMKDWQQQEQMPLRGDQPFLCAESATAMIQAQARYQGPGRSKYCNWGTNIAVVLISRVTYHNLAKVAVSIEQPYTSSSHITVPN